MINENKIPEYITGIEYEIVGGKIVRSVRNNIILNSIPDKYRMHVAENRIIRNEKYYKNFKIMNSIFYRIDRNINSRRRKNRIFINKEDKEIIGSVRERNIKKNTVDWKCSLCKTDIKTIIGNFTPENFTCESCFENHVKNKVYFDRRIIDNSLDFLKQHRKNVDAFNKRYIRYKKTKPKVKKKKK